MTRRLVVVLLAVAGLFGAAIAPARADRGPDHDWVCVFVAQVDAGYCQQNPLPKQLPTVPDAADAADAADAELF